MCVNHRLPAPAPTHVLAANMASLCQYTADYFINPKVIEFWHTRGKQWGPLLAGVCTASQVSLASLLAACCS